MIDYKNLGLKIGLEVHRQLDTHKLFCNCASVLRSDKPDIKINRKLRPVKSEIMEFDIVADFERKKRKYYVYESYFDTNCLVELDEEPPHQINQEALDIGLKISLLFNCDIVDEIQIMRKQVLDGSNTTGFQRSALIAMNGYIKNRGKKINIISVCLEEDAARKINETNEYVVYRLDRLGIPLIEIVTGPDIRDPVQAKEVAEYIGAILKSTKVKSGIGSIRQDLNLSIKCGEKIEIKGVQDLRSIPNIIENEITRQFKIINTGKKINSEVRKACDDNTTSYIRPMSGGSRIYIETDVKPIRVTKRMIKQIELPVTIYDKQKKFIDKFGLSNQLARNICNSKYAMLFESIVNELKIDPTFVANCFTGTLKELEREKLKIENISILEFKEFFKKIGNNEFPKSKTKEILKSMSFGKNLKDLLKDFKKISLEELDKIIDEEAIKRTDIIGNDEKRAFKKLMGPIMHRVNARIDEKLVVIRLKKKINKIINQS